MNVAERRGGRPRSCLTADQHRLSVEYRSLKLSWRSISRLLDVPIHLLLREFEG